MSEATPRPWCTGEAENRGCVYSSDATGSIIAQCDGFKYAPRARKEIEANAALIVQAVNAYDDMLAALRAVMAEHRYGYGLRCEEQVRAAIAKAEGASR